MSGPETESTVLAVASVVNSSPLADVAQAVSSTDVGRLSTEATARSHQVSAEDQLLVALGVQHEVALEGRRRRRDHLVGVGVGQR